MEIEERGGRTEKRKGESGERFRSTEKGWLGGRRTVDPLMRGEEVMIPKNFQIPMQILFTGEMRTIFDKTIISDEMRC